MSLPGQVDHHLVTVGSHDHPVAADGQDTEVGRHVQFGVVEPFDGAGPPLVVGDHDDARRQPELTGARRLVGEAEVDQEPAARAVDHEVVPLLESRRAGRWQAPGRGGSRYRRAPRSSQPPRVVESGAGAAAAGCAAPASDSASRSIASPRLARPSSTWTKSSASRRRVGSAVAVGGQRMHHPGQTGQPHQIADEVALLGERLARIGERHAKPSGRRRARMESSRPCPMTASASSSAHASGRHWAARDRQGRSGSPSPRRGGDSRRLRRRSARRAAAPRGGVRVAAALGDEQVVQAAGGRGVAEHRAAGAEKQVEHRPLGPGGLFRRGREQPRGAPARRGRG